MIDGPYDTAGLSRILARVPANLGAGSCSADANDACRHGTFIMGILGAGADTPIPGLCPGCRLLHFPLFIDERAPSASVDELAAAIARAVTAGAQLINLSLAIVDDDARDHRALGAALDRAAASGAVVLAAAGNQGRRAIGQLLSHPATIPVAGLDAIGRLLPDCNFGPLVARRGIAVPGEAVRGYAPGGGATTVMSGTSAATAVATGMLARVWSARPGADGAAIRAAVARLAPRDGITPPMLDPELVLAALDQFDLAHRASVSPAGRGRANDVYLQGEGKKMNIANGTPNRGAGPAGMPTQAVTLAGGGAQCDCGAPGGVCTCADGQSASQFVYVMGDVDIRFRDPSVLLELETIALTLSKQDVEKSEEDLPERLRIAEHPDANQSLRDWYYRVLRRPQARYIARQVSWILKVLGQPAYYLSLRDWNDLPDLIECLNLPEDRDENLPEDPDENLPEDRDANLPNDHEDRYYADLAVCVGSSPLSPVELCPGIAVPVLAVDQLFRFSLEAMSNHIINKPHPAGSPLHGLQQAELQGLKEIFHIVAQSADNFGDSDERRALNYLAVRYTPIYEEYLSKCRKIPAGAVAPALGVDRVYYLQGVTAAPSRLARASAGKHIVDVILSYQNQNNSVVQKFFVRVDVSYLFPMIVTHYGPYIDR